MDINENIFKQYDIGVAPWPTNSPDLNSIEPYWAYEKDMLENYNIDNITIKKLQQLKE